MQNVKNYIPGDSNNTLKGKVAVVVSEFNQEISDDLLSGFEEEIKKYEGVKYEIIRVPGAFEIPLQAKRLAKVFDVIVALGAVIKGDTYHFELVANECARGCMDVMLSEGVPVVFEVLACYSHEDAVKRSSGEDNMGRAAAFVVLDWLKRKKH